MSDQQNKKSDLGPTPLGSEPIRGLNYDYLDIDKPPVSEPKAVVPETTEYNAVQAKDFYQAVRSKIVKWAKGAGAGKETTQYILLVPDIMALFVRLMADPRVSGQLKAEIAAASAYIISPIDLMPEAVMGPAGLIDDVLVGMLAMNRVVKLMGTAGEDVLRANWDGDDDILFLMKDMLDKAEHFVTGTVWTGIKLFMQNAASNLSNAANPPSSSHKPSGPVVEGSARPILPPNEDE